MTNTPDILARIIARKREEIKKNKEKIPLEHIKDYAQNNKNSRGFVNAIKDKIAGGFPAIIAEIKKASPSKGVLREDFNPFKIAQSYAQAGAACISVLTDTDFFQGSNEDLQETRSACNLPVLRKDFIIDEYQVYETSNMNADCILLIASVLNYEQMNKLSLLSKDLGMDVLVEVHNRHELETSLKLNLPLIGINNRNLHTFETDLNTTINLLDIIDDDTVVVTESGILNASDVSIMRRHNVNAFLVGEGFMCAPDTGLALKELFG